MSDPKNIEPETESTPELDVLILSAEYFFTEEVEVPSALEPSELDDFAELSMEGLAPFPLEQLYWGFLFDPERTTILVYATLRDRLKRAGYEGLENYVWVLPDFATLQGARFSEATQIHLASDAGATTLEFPAGEGLPTKIASRSEPTPAGSTTERPILGLRPLAVELDEKSQPVFTFEAANEAPVEGHWSPLKPEEKSLWRADIRPADFKTTERNTRRTTSWVTKLMGYAALFAVLLIVLEGLLYAGQFWQGTRQAKIESQVSEVRRIEDKQSLMNKLEQVAQNELRPIGILEAANQIRMQLGSTGIEYDEVVIEGTNRITIEGKANTINELNAYTESLRKSGSFDLVGDPRYVTRDSRTTFSVTLDYSHQTRASVEPAAAEAENSPETTG